MSGHRRKTIFASAVLMSGALLLTACQGSESSKDEGAARNAAATAPAGGKTADSAAAGGAQEAGTGKEPGAKGGTGKDGAGTGTGTGTGKDGMGSGADAGDGSRVPVGQVCGANDLSWSTKNQSQGGGYILIVAKAKPGITCTLPGGLPTVAFGSDGTEAGPVQHSPGKPITLSGNARAYAGVSPKTTPDNTGKELTSIIVAIGNEDPDPAELNVGKILVDKPAVTNWQTSEKDALPFN
ncbi:DUF4232 domain-containing protein [Streptomyces sp. NPDC006798]|uniref:DUF4232 domain-containing protein n=1 Tax=Streptomyces sp. NPDC006798 TaxID=3155462 RepID=UPI0033D707D0